jgi:hypothetical protein
MRPLATLCAISAAFAGTDCMRSGLEGAGWFKIIGEWEVVNKFAEAQ